MKKTLAKTLFEEGVLLEAIATVGINGGYNLAFTKKSTGSDFVYLNTDKNNIREFKTADAVISTAKTIGFLKIEFHI
tara:strand:- start:1311 stop:1541 length:231 start_codon:yes stop_codon:yes gene_type:complete